MKSSPPKTKPVLSRALGFVSVVLLVWGGFWLYGTLSEVGLTGILPTTGSSKETLSVHLKRQPIYKIKKKQELLGMNVVRIISRQQPEEFLVLDGVSRKLVDKIYNKPVDLFWANQVANQLLKLREDGEAASPVSVEIQSVKTSRSGYVTAQHRKMPYWQIEVQFKLSNESTPRFYEAAIVRNARQEMTAAVSDSSAPTAQAAASPSLAASSSNAASLKGASPDRPSPEGISPDMPAKDTLVIGYAQKETFQKELLSDLMQQLDFEKN